MLFIEFDNLQLMLLVSVELLVLWIIAVDEHETAFQSPESRPDTTLLLHEPRVELVLVQRFVATQIQEEIFFQQINILGESLQAQNERVTSHHFL